MQPFPLNGGRRAPWAGEFMGCPGRGRRKKRLGYSIKVSEDLCPIFCRRWTHTRSPLEVRDGKTCLLASSREAKIRRGPQPRADHWCRIRPEWRTAPLRGGRQKSIKSTRHPLQVVAAYDVSFFLRANACGVLKYSVKNRPRSDVERRWLHSVSIREVHENQRNSALQSWRAISCAPNAFESLLLQETNTRPIRSTSLTQLRRRLGRRDCHLGL